MGTQDGEMNGHFKVPLKDSFIFAWTHLHCRAWGLWVSDTGCWVMNAVVGQGGGGRGQRVSPCDSARASSF